VIPREDVPQDVALQVQLAAIAGCRRHGGGAAARPPSQPRPPAPTPEPSPAPSIGERTPLAGPLARRLTGSHDTAATDPLTVLRLVLASARRAGYPFEEAWAIGAEGALSHMSRRRAEEWGAS
jgi:hypothetical protein